MDLSSRVYPTCALIWNLVPSSESCESTGSCRFSLAPRKVCKLISLSRFCILCFKVSVCEIEIESEPFKRRDWNLKKRIFDCGLKRVPSDLIVFAPMHWNSISDWVTWEMIIDITNVMSVVVGTNTAIMKDLYSFQFFNYPGKICSTSRPPFCPE